LLEVAPEQMRAWGGFTRLGSEGFTWRGAGRSRFQDREPLQLCERTGLSYLASLPTTSDGCASGCILLWPRFWTRKKSLCRQDPVALREAVEYLEGREPRLALCQSCWGACALLSHRLGYRRQQLRKRQRGEAARARASGDRGTSMVDGGGEAGCGGGGEGGGGGSNAEAVEKLQFLVNL